VRFTKYYSADQIKDDKMDCAYRKTGRDEDSDTKFVFCISLLQVVTSKLENVCGVNKIWYLPSCSQIVVISKEFGSSYASERVH